MSAADHVPAVYQRTQVEGAEPQLLVVLLARALVKFVLRAREAMQRADFEAKATALDRARAILSELHCSLDQHSGGDLAQNLAALYAHWYRQLVEADLGDDLQRLDYVLQCAQKLADTWEEAYEKCRQQERQQAA